MTPVFIAAPRTGSAPAAARLRGLLVSAALLPWLAPVNAAGETVVSGAVTTPVATSTAASGSPDDLTIAEGGSIKPPSAGPAVTLDSDNRVVNRGTISIENLDDSTGVLVLGGRSGSVENAGAINVIESYEATDADGDGDLDGGFAQGARRYGVRVTGPFAGSIANTSSGTIAVEGADSAGVSVEGRFEGDLANAGSISVVGDRSVGVRATDVGGSVRITGSVAAVGEGAAGMSLGDVDGAVVIQAGVSTTGYRVLERGTDAARGKLDADDLKQGGAALRISGSVGGGVLLDRPPIDTDADNADEDADGVLDVNEGTGVLTSRGSAPALDIGGAGATVFGRVGEGENAYGLVIRGEVQAHGINDGVSATGIRIGQPGGGGTTLEGGLNVAGGAVLAEAYEADARAIEVNAGAAAPELRNSGVISARSTSEGAATASGVLIEAGATVAALRNGGRITAQVLGAKGDAQAIVDRSGSLSLIENTGTIQALVTPAEGESAAGRAVALDLRANSGGVLIRQMAFPDGDDGADGVADADADADGIDDADEPTIQGDILLGAGDDSVELANGSFFGALAFGDGAGLLRIDGGAQAVTALSGADGRLQVDVRKGGLTLAQTGVLRLSSLVVGAEGVLTFTLDPRAGAHTRIDAVTATIESGAEIAVQLKSLLKAPESYQIIQAGALRADGLDSLIAGTPYLYSASLRADPAAGSLYVDVRPRTAQELGLRRSGAQAYGAVLAALDRDSAIEAAFLSKTSQEGFEALYDQMLPDHSGAALMSVAAVSNAVAVAVEQRGDAEDAEGGGFWMHEIFLNLDQDRRQALGYRAKGFGLAGGLEQVGAGGTAYGLSLSIASAEYRDQGAAAGERVVMNFGQAGIYVRKDYRGWVADVSAAAGVAGFDSDRRLVSAADSLDVTAKADWLAWLVNAHLGLSYEWRLGAFHARPRLALDYLHLSERSYEESGGGIGYDLNVESRSGDQLTGTAALSLGLLFGESSRWGPEVTVGWRERLAGAPGRTTARFGDGAQFTLDPESPYAGGALLRVGLRGQGAGFVVTMDGGLEQNDQFQQWDIRASAKLRF